MDNDELKKYSVILDQGSGCLFQPMTTEYTYILTSKHIFEGKKGNDKGEQVHYEKQENEVINILRFKKNSQNWIETAIDFKFNRGENYFPHKNADIAILKINHINDFDRIFIQNDFENESGFILSGCPNNFRNNIEGEKYTNYPINNFTNSNNYSYGAQLLNNALTRDNIEGMSGGGIMKISANHIYIIGIQSKMANKLFPTGQIGFVPIKYFNDIIEYPEYSGKLTALLPIYLKSFDFLKDKAFDINASINDEDISYTRFFLKQKTKEVIESNITPHYIKEYFNERLLLNENNPTKLENEIIYITWLEFLTILNIAKSKIHNTDDLEELFNFVRLIYKDTSNDWLDNQFLKECLIGDYQGLKESGTVLIKTNKLPVRAKIEHYKLSKGCIVPRVDGLRKDFLQGNLTTEVENIANALTDLNVFAFDKFNFIHFEYLKQFMLVENCEDFKCFNRENEVELLTKLKKEYGKLFGI